MNRITLSSLILTVLLGATAMTPALGQAAGSASAPKSQLADASDSADIIVTAERREQNVQKVAGVVAALTSEQLRISGINDLRSLQVAVTGLNIANQEGNVEIYIRGVGSSNNTELGDPGAAPHINGVYIPRPRGLGSMFYDLERVEVNKGPQGTLYGRNALAGTLNIITAKPKLGQWGGFLQGEYGNRSSYGFEGALNIPLGQTFAVRAAGFYVDKDFGFHNVSTGAIARDLKPAGLEKNYGGRLSALWEPNDKLSMLFVGDYGKETGTGYPGANIFSAVVASGLRPQNLHLKDVVYRGTQGDLNNELWGVLGKIGYDFGGFSAEASASYRSVDFNQTNASSDGIDYPGRDLSTVQYDNYSSNYWQTRSKSQVYELRLFADASKALRWTTGAFYFKEKQGVGLLSLADRGYCCYSGTEFVMPDVRGKSYAVYADATYDVTDRLRVFGGGRYSEEKKSRYGIGGNLSLTLGGEDFACCFGTRFGTPGFKPNLLDRPNFDVSVVQTKAQVAQFLIESIKTPGIRDTLIQQIQTIANGTNLNGTCIARPDIDNGFVKCPALNPSNTNGGFSYSNLGIPSQQIGKSKFDYSDYRAGVEFDLATDKMVYAKVSTGHKSGGFNDSFNGSTIPETYSPEKVTVYEIGSRNVVELGGRRSVLNLTGFYYDYTNQVFQDLTCIGRDVAKMCNSYSLVNRNIGSSRIFGVEAETRFSLPAGISFEVNFTYLDTKITSGVVADSRGQDFGNGGVSPLISLKGNELPLASKYNLNVKFGQYIDIGSGRFDYQVLWNLRSSYYLSQFNEDDIVFVNGTRQTAQAAGFPDKQEGYSTVNLGAGYTFGRYRIEGWASNVFDFEASSKALVGSSLNIRFLNDARSYGLRGRVNF